MKHYNKKDILGIIFFMASILILVYMFLTPLDHLIIYIDEYFTVSLITLPVSDIITITSGDVHPPLYYLIAKFGVEIATRFGIDFLYGLKVVSIVPYILILILSPTKIKKDYTWFSAGLFALSLGIMSEFFSHIVRARMYSWAILFVLIAFMAFMDIMKSNDKRSWILLTIFSALSAYTHYFAAIASGAIYLVLLIYLMKFDKERIKSWAASLAAAALLYVPWIFTLWAQMATIQHKYWIRGANLNTIVDSLGYFSYNGNVFFSIAAIVIVIAIVLIYLKEGAGEKDKFSTLGGIGVYVGTIAIALVFSVIFRPILVIRYLLPAAAVLWLTISIILGRITDKRRFLISSALIALLLVNGAFATISTNEYLYGHGVDQKEIFDNITQDPNSTLIVTNQNLVMYFLSYANQTDMYCINSGQIFGEDMSRLHQFYEFKSYKDIDGVIANNTDRNIYIISWGDPDVNSTVTELDKEVNVVFSRVNQTD